MAGMVYMLAGCALALTVALTSSVGAQQPGGVPPGMAPGGDPSGDTPQPMMQQMREMMQQMRGIVQQIRHMVEDEAEDEEESAPRGGMRGRGPMGRGMMMHPHLQPLLQQLDLTDTQRAQVRTLLRHHAKEAMRLRADIGTLSIDVHQLLDTDPVELPKVKQLLQTLASKEADLHYAHITLMQDITKLLTPEQQKKFQAMRGHTLGDHGIMGRGMMGHGTMGHGKPGRGGHGH